MAEIQDLSIDDILQGQEYKNRNRFGDTSIMITGAGSSIGSEWLDKLLKGDQKNCSF